MNDLPKTAVVLDSTTYIPDAFLREHGVERVSLYVKLDGAEEREFDISDYSDFHSRLRASSSGATTSQPSIGDFLEVWLPILDSGRDIVSIHLSSAISGTHEAATMARQQLVQDDRGGERVHIIDSGSGAGGTGMCAIAAIMEASTGGDPEAIERRYNEALAGLEMRFAVDSLEYLRRGGRIGSAQALLGSALKIKPILSFEAGIVPVTKVRTRQRALDHLREFARDQAAIEDRYWMVQHVDSPEAAEQLANDCREIYGCEPGFMTEVGPVLGAHTGPGFLVGSIARSAIPGEAPVIAA